jgi:hypothetical protein
MGAVVPGGERLAHIDADKPGRRVRLHLRNQIHVGQDQPGPSFRVPVIFRCWKNRPPLMPF